MVKNFFLAVAASAVLLSGVPAFAQSPPDTSAPSTTAPQRPRGEHGMQQRVQAFHDKLGITAAQQPQWDAMVATMRDNMRDMRADPTAQAIRTGQVHGLAAVRAAADLARQRADAMQRMVPAVEGLYNVLSPEQRQIADQRIDRMLHHGGRRNG